MQTSAETYGQSMGDARSISTPPERLLETIVTSGICRWANVCKSVQQALPVANAQRDVSRRPSTVQPHVSLW
jgi:hypothetical protein